MEKPVDLVNYMELIPISIQAIKEQSQIIQQLQSEIKALQEEIKNLKKK
ncbi:MAG TPA: hypothetical protein VLB74_07765 [Flavobacterium sp.]|nr:hypothetical protein [Flavobacterium sp.]HSD14529.1 hypothetical protein [Flavobacterium sp.]